jgi:hypothetical protein
LHPERTLYGFVSGLISAFIWLFMASSAMPGRASLSGGH